METCACMMLSDTLQPLATSNNLFRDLFVYVAGINLRLHLRDFAVVPRVLNKFPVREIDKLAPFAGSTMLKRWAKRSIHGGLVAVQQREPRGSLSRCRHRPPQNRASPLVPTVRATSVTSTETARGADAQHSTRSCTQRRSTPVGSGRSNSTRSEALFFHETASTSKLTGQAFVGLAPSSPSRPFFPTTNIKNTNVCPPPPPKSRSSRLLSPIPLSESTTTENPDLLRRSFCLFAHTHLPSTRLYKTNPAV